VARKGMVAASCVLMMSAIPAIMTTNVWVSIAFISIATFGYTSYNANALAFPADVVPKNMVASVWGLASMGSGFGGMLFSWLSGRLIDRYGYTPVFIGYGIIPLIVLLLIVFGIGPLRPLRGFEAAMESSEA
jgi:ACS family hexuronate transporter-like MFS transporter